jgi:predicted nucleic acid-binding protein
MSLWLARLEARHEPFIEPRGVAINGSVAGPRLCGSFDSHMTRFVVDCGVVLKLASEAIEVRAEHELLAPTLLRSQTLSALHAAVHAGEVEPDVALDRLNRIWAMPIRLLGDAVLRRLAWKLAGELGWAETYDAEYVALTRLQADAFVTLDADLARRVEGVVPTATIDALRTG